LIPGVNDTTGDLEAAADFARSIPGVRQVNLLPYHRTGLAKLNRLGREAELAGTMPPSGERMAAARDIFERAGLHTRIGG
jgi:pyruvate formate lyase activating enzyme